MEDDDLLFEINESRKKSRTSFESVLNRKNMDMNELDSMMNGFY